MMNDEFKMEIYQVLATDTLYLSIEDFDDMDRERMNRFFKSNYGFEFKNINSKAFEAQLNNALMKTPNAVDIIVEMARVCLKGKKNPNWQKVIRYYYITDMEGILYCQNDCELCNEFDNCEREEKCDFLEEFDD